MKGRVVWIGLSLVLLVSSKGLTQGQSGSSARPKPTQQQESFMLGRVLGIVQDVGGYNDEALHRCSGVLPDLKTYDYSAQVQWLACQYCGEAQRQKGDKKAALKTFSCALEHARRLSSKELVQSLRSLGGVHAELGQLNQAIEQYNSALAISPQDRELKLDLAAAYRQGRRLVEAQGIYEDVLKEDPKSANALEGLGIVYVERGEYAAALSAFERLAASSVENRHPAAMNIIRVANHYVVAANREKALEAARRAVQLSPQDPVVLVEVGFVFLTLDERGEATDAFNQALGSNAPKPIAQRAKQGLKEARKKD